MDVELFCEDEEFPRASTISIGDGYFFNSSADNFSPGETCFLEAFKDVGGGNFYDGQTDPFVVQEGLNEQLIPATLVNP